MSSNDDLHPLLRNINASIGKLREDVQTLIGEVRKIPTLLEEGFTQLRDAIHESIQAQAEFKIMEHMMEVSAVKPQLAAEREQIGHVQDELEARLDSIRERYQRKQDDLNETAGDRVRELGSHIFAIEEEQFAAGVEEPFTTQVTPVWRDLQVHNELVHRDRQRALIDQTEAVVDRVETFLTRQDELVTQIDDHLLEPATIPAAAGDQTEIQLPYYVVTYQVDGVTDQTVVPPAELRHTGDEAAWSAAELDPLPGASRLADETRSLGDGPTSTDMIDQSAVTATLDQYGSSSPFGASYTEAVEAALADPVEITIEGGED